jgi:hypothetical protein
MTLLCSLTPLCRKNYGGKVTFISVQPKENDDVRIVQPPMEQVTRDGTMGSMAFLSSYSDDHQHDDCEDDDVMTCAATSSKRDASTSSRDKKAAVERDEESAASRAKGVKVRHKRKQNGNNAEMMRRYLELKTKQTEEEVVELELRLRLLIFPSRIAMLYLPQWKICHVKREQTHMMFLRTFSIGRSS